MLGRNRAHGALLAEDLHREFNGLASHSDKSKGEASWGKDSEFVYYHIVSCARYHWGMHLHLFKS